MLDFFTYPHRITAALVDLGYEKSDFPIIREWIGLIHEFRKARYSPEQAAALLHRALSDDAEALADVISIGGVYAVTLFGMRALARGER